MARGWSVKASAASHSFLSWGAHPAPIPASQGPGREQELWGSFGSGTGWLVGSPLLCSPTQSQACALVMGGGAPAGSLFRLSGTTTRVWKSGCSYLSGPSVSSPPSLWAALTSVLGCGGQCSRRSHPNRLPVFSRAQIPQLSRRGQSETCR